MQVLVRFTWQHDLDLIALKKHPSFELGNQLKRALRAYVREEEGFLIPLPRDMPEDAMMDNCSCSFTLKPTEDADVIEFLNTLHSGHKTSAIKLIFRSHLDSPFILPYITGQCVVKSRRPSQDSSSGRKKTPAIDQNHASEKQISTDIAKDKLILESNVIDEVLPDKNIQEESKEFNLFSSVSGLF